MPYIQKELDYADVLCHGDCSAWERASAQLFSGAPTARASIAAKLKQLIYSTY
ncbi:MAG: hypothetical protein R3F37_13725 [Candidatus Competibacteraceae bacterium]